jgi:hypothetical protein
MTTIRRARAQIPSVLAYVLLAGISCQISCTRRTANFEKMEIDPTTMKVQLRNELPWPNPPASDHYFRFPISDGRYLIDHFGAAGKVRYNAFFVGADDAIYTKTKYQILLSGPFGRVYAESTYFYPPYYKDQPTQFFSVLYMNGLGCEPFQVVSTLPASETLRLSAISVIRVFPAPPEFLVVSANYAPDGHLESLHVNGSKHGDWVHSNEIHGLYPDIEVATMIGDRPKTRERFGIPATFPVKHYHHNQSDVFQDVDLKSALDVVNYHYERNRWVRQDSFLPEGAAETRFLTYVNTSEDKVLEPVDGALLFGQFPYTRADFLH